MLRALSFCLAAALASSSMAQQTKYELNDGHVHLTDYIQEGTTAHSFLTTVMGRRVGRSVLFGIPLQQMWSHRVSGDEAPTYYLESDAPLYYYSFTDAFIAEQYRSLSPAQRARFDPMITGFNPADMYAADHVRRVLETYPGVFVGIGEFSIHKEFVTSKVAGVVPSLRDPALDRLFLFAGEVGLVVLLHNDIGVPFPEEGEPPAYYEQLTALFRRHSRATIIWAHIGLGRIIRPVEHQVMLVERILEDPELRHVHFDLSWDEVAKYLTTSPGSADRAARVINRHPDRFIFGTDEVAPSDARAYFDVVGLFDPLFERLEPSARELVRKGNYQRIFDEARLRVRAWEARNVPSKPSDRD